MEGTDAVMDIPIGGVCEILYGQGDDESVNGDAGHG
jgi:phosphatidylinositol glycan class P protein